jgi:hypothetical protein
MKGCRRCTDELAGAIAKGRAIFYVASELVTVFRLYGQRA